VYVLFLVATRSAVLAPAAWPVRLVSWLVLGSLALVLLSLVLLAHYSDGAPNSTYIPAHIEHGKLVPGVEK
jgi:hypothetical protein